MTHRKARETFLELQKYLKRLRDRKRADIHEEKRCNNFSLLGEIYIQLYLFPGPWLF